MIKLNGYKVLEFQGWSHGGSEQSKRNGFFVLRIIGTDLNRDYCEISIMGFEAYSFNGKITKYEIAAINKQLEEIRQKIAKAKEIADDLIQIENEIENILEGETIIGE